MEIAVALVAALAAVTAAWWGQPGRRALGIHRYVQLLNDLPSDSPQRKRLAREIDKMVGTELDDRVMNEVVRMVWTVYGFFVVAFVATSVAQKTGGAWILAAVVSWCLTALTTVVLGIGLWHRWADRDREASLPRKAARKGALDRRAGRAVESPTFPDEAE